MVVNSDLTEEQADQIIETTKLEYPDAVTAKTKQKNGLWTVVYRIDGQTDVVVADNVTEQDADGLPGA
ncbi:hypothetical protein FZ983_20930 [Azospirillum sp. B21]|uniref:hypothetical protein n=1 Tax=Azospirillum sp. B21 TaxID=2607496 RepID=UPI0011EF38AB|nr:hypothetical protein [Azospirillum sp. B21]KAA0577342.1 hypothetical protein FZ983_20930 [Azospirillum sp. B21]